MRIAICDDNLDMTQNLKKNILLFFKQQKTCSPSIDIFYSGESFLDSGDKYDILFLDIEMPGFSGIYVGKEIKKRCPSIIIFVITSFSEYLDDAMRFHVFRYLSKPLDKQRLFRNLQDALELFLTRSKKINIETKQGVIVANSSDIICIEAKDRKTIIYTPDGIYSSIHNMQYWCSILCDGAFSRPHRSYLINLRFVSNFNHTMIYLYNNQISAYLTRRKYTEFKNSYLLYLEHCKHQEL